MRRRLAVDAEDSRARSRFVGQVGIQQQPVRSLWMRQKAILLVKIAYSVLACFRMMMPGSAFFHKRENPGKQSWLLQCRWAGHTRPSLKRARESIGWFPITPALVENFGCESLRMTSNVRARSQTIDLLLCQ